MDDAWNDAITEKRENERSVYQRCHEKWGKIQMKNTTKC